MDQAMREQAARDQATGLRNIIKQGEQKPLSRVITVTSGKGGVGKSSLSLNLAIALQRLGRRVVILDADFGLSNIEVMLGIQPKHNLGDLIFKGRRMREVITEGPLGVGLVSGGAGMQEMASLTRDQLRLIRQRLWELDELADVVLVDTGAGIADSVLEFVMASPETLLVVTPEPTSLTDAYALLKALDGRGEASCGDGVRMVANRVGTAAEGDALFQKLDSVIQKFLKVRLGYLGAVPQDSLLTRSTLQQRPVTIAYPKSPSARAVEDLARALEGNAVSEWRERKGIAGFFTDLVRRVGGQ